MNWLNGLGLFETAFIKYCKRLFGIIEELEDEYYSENIGKGRKLKIEQDYHTIKSLYKIYCSKVKS